MNTHLRWNKAGRDDLFLDPLHHVVARPTIIVSQIMIEADNLDHPRSKQFNHFLGPLHASPAVRRFPFVIEIDFHDAFSRLSVW